ncbi:NAD-dependent epimerase/dehydratase family protein [Chryseobacterium sp.]|uniref:NAD-dependent epimerase/dehydratase family protein n=1 Tax=Chryseobacterium sp. TaxID=1871047 RepID=UPI00289E06BF|nr:NAD-dependent epimerase/dehydratase family protein [Chryseobacterium sp.]
MKNIFVTGITGLLGTNLVIDLLENNYQVKALLRDANSYTEINHPNLQLIQGSLFDNIEKYLDDIDVFIHIAAETNQNITKYHHYKKVNCEATKHLYLNCVKCGVKKFIFIGTANTIGCGSFEKPGNETHPIRKPFTNSMYAQSKLEAEDFLLSQNNNTKTIILNPTFMLGAYDRKPSSGKIILMGWKKKIIFYPPGGKNFVNVKNVSQGIINSIQFGKNGEKYLLANENLTYKEFFERLNKITDQNPLMIKIPKTILICIGYIGDLCRKVGIKTNISSTNMKTLCITNNFENTKSTKELKINYQKIDLGIQDAIDYFEKCGK